MFSFSILAIVYTHYHMWYASIYENQAIIHTVYNHYEFFRMFKQILMHGKEYIIPLIQIITVLTSFPQSLQLEYSLCVVYRTKEKLFIKGILKQGLRIGIASYVTGSPFETVLLHTSNYMHKLSRGHVICILKSGIKSSVGT